MGPMTLATRWAARHRSDMRTMRSTLIAATTCAVAFIAAPALAGAAPGDNDDFGGHVAECAHHMGGFNGVHNPGMHAGRAGWDGAHCHHDE